MPTQSSTTMPKLSGAQQPCWPSGSATWWNTNWPGSTGLRSTAACSRSYTEPARARS